MQVERAERQRVVFRDDAAPLDAGHHSEAEVRQPARRLDRMPGAAAEPQERPSCAEEALRKLVEIVVSRVHRFNRYRLERNGALDLRSLDVDGNLDAHRAAWWRQRRAYRFSQRAERRLRAANAECRFGNGSQHFQLLGRFVNVGEIAI